MGFGSLKSATDVDDFVGYWSMPKWLPRLKQPLWHEYAKKTTLIRRCAAKNGLLYLPVYID